MDILVKKNFVYLVQFLLFMLIGCSPSTKSDNDKIVIKIGTFTVDQEQFESRTKKLTTINEDFTQEDAAHFVLDNYISAGLLVETAKKLNYEQRNDFIKEDSSYKEQLIIKFSKYRRANKNKLHRVNESIVKEMMQHKIKLDYIRIPKRHKELSQSMLLYFLNGSSMLHILEDPELPMWNSSGLSFYEDISLNQAILTEKVIKEIMMMKDDEVKLIHDNSAYYVVRILQSIKSPYIDTGNNEPVFQNLLMAQSLEKDDNIFDPYRFTKAIKCNENLLSKIDFSIPPFHSDSDFIVKIDGRFIRENDIKEKIYGLPVKIQSLFVNRTTRARAIATLILNNKDGIPEKVSGWLQPNKINGYNQLYFDFDKIEKMEITQKNTIDDQILAYSDNWSMTVKDFKKELDKLTPITRLDIANNNLLPEMIEYLAEKNNIPKSKLIVNSNLFKSIDIMGNSYDQLNYVFDENTIVGKLGKFDISVKELREIITKLSEYDKNKFLNLTSRNESFNEIITKKFWLNLYDRKIIEDNPDFKKELSGFQNNLLAELLYKSEIQVNIPQIDDGNLNWEMQRNVKSTNEDKLLYYIQTIMKDYPIQVKGKFFQKFYNLDIGTSKYNKLIINNIN